ncbi:somatoliberin [Aplochiton taeniatus]
MTMERVTLLVLCCLVMSLTGSPLSPSIRFGQRDMSILMTSAMENPVQLIEEDNARPESELRSEVLRLGRHADAIFTNSYRKVLGQISARRFLQRVIGKRLRDTSESYVKRQSDIYEGTYKQDLTSIQSEHIYRGQHEQGRKAR